MKSIIFLYLLIYSGFLSVVLFGGYSRLKRKLILNNPDAYLDLTDITVIVPFRNESQRILPILESIKKSIRLPYQFIFVNDHSTDETSRIIMNELGDYGFKIIDLPPELKGKKRAIEFGVYRSKTKYILTLDADIQFDIDYFQRLENLPEADMHILPVCYFSQSYFGSFFQQDVHLANYMNYGISGWKRPILASGANLLYQKSKYLETVSDSTYFESSSGDDIFLLRALQNKNTTVMNQIGTKHVVHTRLAKTGTEFLNQRMRWLGKSMKVNDKLANTMALIQFFFSILNWVFLTLAFCWLSNQEFILFVLLKFLVEWSVHFSFYRDFGYLRLWLFLPIYILILPMINLVMAVSFLGVKPKWKDRLVIK